MYIILFLIVNLIFFIYKKPMKNGLKSIMDFSALLLKSRHMTT
jgi:hypothetical protein